MSWKVRIALMLPLFVWSTMNNRLHAETYYVDAVLGGSVYNGLLPGNQFAPNAACQTIQQAVDLAEANTDSNDRIFVIVGTYNEEVTITEDGIELIGYENSFNVNTGWSDLDDGRGVPANYNETRGLANGMPVMHEQPEINLGNRAAGNAIVVFGSNVFIRNFTIHDCKNGVVGNGATGATALSIENIVGYNFGPLINSDQGRGILISTVPQCDVVNCRILNAGGYGVLLSEQSTLGSIINTQVYCDEGDPGQGEGDGSDYYFVITNTRSCTLTNCRAERHDGGDGVFSKHLGHGFVLKGTTAQTKSNRIEDCEAIQVNEAFWFLGQTCTENLVVDCYANRTDTSENVGVSIFFSNGASNNRAKKTHIKNARGGVTFDVDGGVSGNTTLITENTIENCIFERCENTINLNPHNGNPGTKAKDNEFRNCTFTGRLTPTMYQEWPLDSGTYEDSRGLFYAHRDNENTTFTNCIFTDFPIKEFISTAAVISGKVHYSVDVTFDHCCFYECGAGFPETQQAMDADSDYTDCILTQSFPFIGSIWPNSIVIDQGTSVPEVEDFFGSPRLDGPAVDIGAFED
ncbi:hypothetical protein ACFL2H_06405 [Planctomycetota bacterium]